MKRLAGPALAVFLSASLSVSGCGPRRPPAPPNVILITIDTLRADRLPAAGYRRRTAPFLEQLASRGCVFRRCSATSPWTSPSMASLFTGLYPRSHGVRHGFVEQGKIVNQERLAESFLTLAEALREHGYATFGISTNGHVSPETGMAQGFDEFTSLWFTDAASAHASAVEMKEKLRSGRPFFFWIHYFDPHAPYQARDPWISEYCANPVLAREWGMKTMKELKEEKDNLREHPELLDTLRGLYDSEISYTDQFIERLFREVLPESGSLIIVTSDHGEGFLEHGQVGHGDTLFEEEIAVPLLVVFPKGEERGKEIQEPVSLIDIYPTILDQVGMAARPELPGRSLLPAPSLKTAAAERPLFLQLDRGASLVGVRQGMWKLITRPLKRRFKWMLFDLEADPREGSNLVRSRPDMVDRLSGRLSRWEELVPEFAAPSAAGGQPPRRIDDLKSLGYLQ